MPNTRHTYFPGSEGTHFAGMPVQHSVRVAARICPVFRFLTGNVPAAPEPRLRVIGRIEPPAFDVSGAVAIDLIELKGAV